MKGTITYFNAVENTGAIQSDDGLLLKFSTESLSPNQDYSKLVNGCRVDFDLEDKLVVNMVISKEQNFLEDNIFYLEPLQTGIITSGIPEGYELIDSSDIALNREARNSKALKFAFIDLCEKLGGNVVLDYKEERFTRNSIGFSFYMYRGTARVGLIAKRADENTDGALSLRALKHKIRHEGIEKIADDEKKSKLGLKIVKISGAILLIIFTIGFLMSGS
ncbi:hypothetical protein [Succinivibrio dextrinosolvens]|uniref:hypothetical protein n=1 Tax=Succinivibrio dextrinosolvens TaxID=83771 RepID=UPI0004E2220B|nr:hypothetical protein [Succinivibrio dextrinosolvens]